MPRMVAHRSPTLKIDPSVPIKKPDFMGFGHDDSLPDLHLANYRVVERFLEQSDLRSSVYKNFLEKSGFG